MFKKFIFPTTLGLSLITSINAETNEAGLTYLEKVRALDGVKTLKSGLSYKVLKEGTGKYAPKKDSPCKCHYAGTTPSLTENPHEKTLEEWDEFDSSYKRGDPTTFAPNQVIKGWTEAMQLMREGEQWEMYIPSDLGYGDSGTGDKIKGGDVLVFRMEILEIQGKKKRLAKCDYKTGENCEETELALYKKYSEIGMVELEKTIKEMEKKMEGGLKQSEVKGIQDEYKEMRSVMKILKKMEKKEAKAGGKEEL